MNEPTIHLFTQQGEETRKEQSLQILDISEELCEVPKALLSNKHNSSNELTELRLMPQTSNSNTVNSQLT